MQISSTSGALDNRQSVVSLQNAEETPEEAPEEKGDETTGVESGFSEFMRAALGGAAKTEVNEEELFAGLVEQRLNKENAEAAELFKQKKAELSVSLARADGYVSVEEVTVQALKATVQAQAIDQTTAEKINGEAFAAAQLDSNLDALYDGRGSDNDPTKAVSAMDAALSRSAAEIEAIEAGTKTAASRSLDAPINVRPDAGVGDEHGAEGEAADPAGAPSGGSIAKDGSGGFLWKPVSESNGNLVVLLPSSLNGLVDKVEIHSKLPPDETSKLGEGNYSGIKNGDRTHWRFSEPGEEYGSNVHVVVFKDDGSTVTYDIEDGSKRID